MGKNAISRLRSQISLGILKIFTIVLNCNHLIQQRFSRARANSLTEKRSHLVQTIVSPTSNKLDIRHGLMWPHLRS
jgi:hypothetical protein